MWLDLFTLIELSESSRIVYQFGEDSIVHINPIRILNIHPYGF